MKVLEYIEENELAPVGGPRGYLYNVKMQRDLTKDSQIEFINEDNKLNSFCFECVDSFFKILLTLTHREHLGNRKALSRLFFRSKYFGNIDLFDFDIIHFHNTLEFYSEKVNLKKYQGIVVLTSHSPKVSFRENIEDVADIKLYKKNKKFYDSLEQADVYAFERADYIIFPCPGAEEPYFHSWPKYREIRDPKKIKYVPTGIIPVTCKRNRTDIRTQYHIPEDAVLLSFVGRHNEVKGYDILQDIFNKLQQLNDGEKYYVICCGKIGNIQPPKSDHWVEIGWTDDPYSIVGASDIYMLPNRETYFDIAMLQTLSIGKMSVISNTGGNKEFKNTPGVELYDTISQAVLAIQRISSLDPNTISGYETGQREEFKNKYDIKVFYDNYKKTLKEMLDEKGISGRDK